MFLLKYKEYIDRFQEDVMNLLEEDLKEEIEIMSQIVDICKEYEDEGMAFEFDLGLSRTFYETNPATTKALKYATRYTTTIGGKSYTIGGNLFIPREIISMNGYLSKLFERDGNLGLCLRLTSFNGNKSISLRSDFPGDSDDRRAMQGAVNKFKEFGNRVCQEFPELGLKYVYHHTHYFRGYIRRKK